MWFVGVPCQRVSRAYVFVVCSVHSCNAGVCAGLVYFVRDFMRGIFAEGVDVAASKCNLILVSFNAARRSDGFAVAVHSF